LFAPSICGDMLLGAPAAAWAASTMGPCSRVFSLPDVTVRYRSIRTKGGLHPGPRSIPHEPAHGGWTKSRWAVLGNMGSRGATIRANLIRDRPTANASRADRTARDRSGETVTGTEDGRRSWFVGRPVASVRNSASAFASDGTAGPGRHPCAARYQFRRRLQGIHGLKNGQD